ncbi:hypothetical protein [Saccharopolyspora hattusasensis]|uniref:hypothetical protein n=1 Tax=Saccharopolyspora hattusasensis TaxID=1128679 RepID=UPI003D972E59
MTTAQEHFEVGQALFERYKALQERVGADWTTGARQAARALLLSIAARYRAAIAAGHPRADGLAWSVDTVTGWAEDHAIWIAFDLTAPEGVS